MNNDNNTPNHYKVAGRKECIEEIEDDLTLLGAVVFACGNVKKYRYRKGLKINESADVDEGKAVHYETYATDKLKKLSHSELWDMCAKLNKRLYEEWIKANL